MLYTGNLNKSITMNTLISIGCIITDQLYSPLWPHETTKILKNPKKN